MNGVFTYQGGRFEMQECITCGVSYAMPAVLLDRAREKGGYHTCPNGHSQGWSTEDSQEEKTRRERDRLKQQLAQRDDEIAAEKRKSEAAVVAAERAQKENKRLKKRAAAGTCPCCRRTVSQMAQHMKLQHPEFVAEETTNVVPIKKATK